MNGKGFPGIGLSNRGKRGRWAANGDLFRLAICRLRGGITSTRAKASHTRCKRRPVRNVTFIMPHGRKRASKPANELAQARYQKVAQLYYTLSECIMVHVGGEPLLDEDVGVGNHIITVLSTELVSLSSSPLSSVYTGMHVGVSVRVTRFAHAM